MRTFIICLAVVCFAAAIAPAMLRAQQDTLAAPLQVGNKFYWHADTYPLYQLQYPQYRPLVYYEEILRDTLIQGKRYVVVYNSLSSKLRYQRADARNIYEYVNGGEVKNFSLDAKQGDSIFNIFCESPTIFCNYRFSFKQFGSDASYRILNDTVYTFIQLQKQTPQIQGIPSHYALWSKQLGIQESAYETREGLRMGVFLYAARVNGRVYGDTTYLKDRLISVAQAAAAPSALTELAPNPFTGDLTFGYYLGSPAAVSLSVFSAVTGQRVRTLLSGVMFEGKHTVVWDGKGDDDIPAPQGVYVLRLFVGGSIVGQAKAIKR